MHIFFFLYQYVSATKNRKCWSVLRFIENLPYQFKRLIHSFKEEIVIAVQRWERRVLWFVGVGEGLEKI